MTRSESVVQEHDSRCSFTLLTANEAEVWSEFLDTPSDSKAEVWFELPDYKDSDELRRVKIPGLNSSDSTNSNEAEVCMYVYIYIYIHIMSTCILYIYIYTHTE